MRKRKVWGATQRVPGFAEAKDWHGLRRFRLRGLKKVNGEALLIAAGQNLKRLLNRRGWGRRRASGAPTAVGVTVTVRFPPSLPGPREPAAVPSFFNRRERYRSHYVIQHIHVSGIRHTMRLSGLVFDEERAWSHPPWRFCPNPCPSPHPPHWPGGGDRHRIPSPTPRSPAAMAGWRCEY
jgi:hypothetical protein